MHVNYTTPILHHTRHAFLQTGVAAQVKYDTLEVKAVYRKLS